MFKTNKNDLARQSWDREILQKLAKGKILDVGAGELKNKFYCSHLEYVLQVFCQYKGSGDGAALQNQA